MKVATNLLNPRAVNVHVISLQKPVKGGIVLPVDPSGLAFGEIISDDPVLSGKYVAFNRNVGRKVESIEVNVRILDVTDIICFVKLEEGDEVSEYRDFVVPANSDSEWIDTREGVNNVRFN